MKFALSSPTQYRKDAPHAGARIEIFSSPIVPMVKKTPPTRGRELKYDAENRQHRKQRDAPHAGARIEIRGQNKSPGHYSQTPPTRGRELK